MSDVEANKTIWILVLFFIISAFMATNSGVYKASYTTIRDDLDLTNSQMGYITSCDNIGNAASALVFGFLYGRVPTMGMVTGACIFWSIFAIYGGASQNFGWLLSSRFLLSACEGCMKVVAPPVINAVAPLRYKATWMAVFWSSNTVGAQFGALTGGTYVGNNSEENPSVWRAPLYVSAILMVPPLLVSLFLAVRPDIAQHYLPVDKKKNFTPVEDEAAPLSESKRHEPWPDNKKKNAVSQIKLFLANTGAMYLVFGSGFFQVIPLSGYAAFTYAYVEEYFGWPASQSSTAVAALLLVTTLSGIMMGGALVDYLRAKEGLSVHVNIHAIRSATAVVFWTTTLCAVFLFLGFSFDSIEAFFLFFGFGMFFGTATASPTASIILWDTQAQCGALGLGVMIVVHACGAALGPIVFGYLADAYPDNWRRAFFIGAFFTIPAVLCTARGYWLYIRRTEEVSLGIPESLDLTKTANWRGDESSDGDHDDVVDVY